MRKTIGFLSGTLLGLTLAVSAQAAVSSAEAAKLGQSLTPFGAEVAGNGKDVSTGLGIPAWTGGITGDKIPSTYTHAGQYHPNPFASDKVLFKINVQDMDKYADKLTDGVKAMLKTYPDTFHLNVYQSRRSTSAPEWVYKNMKNNATSATLVHGGNGVQDAFGGIPFPILSGSSENKALQAVWNHILRWRGVYVVRRATEAPVQADGSYVPITTQEEVYFRYYDPKYSYKKLNNTIFYYLTFTKSPPRLAGGAVLVRETLNQDKEPRQAWGYNAGQRRVRRAPNIAYDMPIPQADGLRTADEVDMYNGSPQKFTWKLLHDQPVEMFIPYNNYKLDDGKLKYKQILKPGHIASDLQRWELHRVWVVQGTLKKGERHIYHKRVFYIDADSWQIAETDEYDSRDTLWRVGLAYIMNYYEVPVQWSVLDVHHDLRAKRYDVTNLQNENGFSQDFTQSIPNARYFSPASLSRRGH